MAEGEFVIDVGTQNFEAEVLQRSLQMPVLVDFWAAWCAPCKALTPILTKVASDYGGAFMLAKVDTDAHQQLAMQCGIRSLPTVMLVREGQIVDGFVGAQPESAVRALLEKHGITPLALDESEPPSVSEQLGGDRLQAIEALRAMMGEGASDESIALELGELLVLEGRYAEAHDVLQKVPESKNSNDRAQRLQAALRLAELLKGAPDPAVLRAQLQENPTNSEALYQFGIQSALSGDHEAGLESLLAVVRRDRKYGDDAARKAMIDVFTMLGGSGPLVKQYRSLLYSAIN
ncbi:MAG: thioredoxin [Gammaproteobacteria bacterium]